MCFLTTRFNPFVVYYLLVAVLPEERGMQLIYVPEFLNKFFMAGDYTQVRVLSIARVLLNIFCELTHFYLY